MTQDFLVGKISKCFCDSPKRTDTPFLLKFRSKLDKGAENIKQELLHTAGINSLKQFYLLCTLQFLLGCFQARHNI